MEVRLRHCMPVGALTWPAGPGTRAPWQITPDYDCPAPHAIMIPGERGGRPLGRLLVDNPLAIPVPAERLCARATYSHPSVIHQLEV